MIAYVKRFSDFRTILALRVIESDAVIASTGSEPTMLTVAGTQITFGNVGDWIVFGDVVYLIDTVTPGEGTTAIRCADAVEAFDRALPYTAPGAVSVGGWIAEQLRAAYRDIDDTAYSMPYIDVSCRDATPFVAPEVDDDGYYCLSDYIRRARADCCVLCQFAAGEDKLRVRIRRVSRAAHSIVFTDGHAQLVSRAFSRAAAAKITVLQEVAETVTATDWYLSADGAASTSVPAQRAAGEWIKMSVSASADAADKVAAKFAQRGASHKIEFWADRSMALHDRVTIRLDGGVVTSTISYIGKKSGDSRRYYKSGELAVTLTDKLRGVI